MKKIIYCLMAGLFVLSITSCHDKHMKPRKKTKTMKSKEVKYYRDTPEYKEQMREYNRCKDPNRCPEKFERNERRW